MADRADRAHAGDRADRAHAGDRADRADRAAAQPAGDGGPTWPDLLSHLTANALDADYAYVARGRRSHARPGRVAAVVLAVFGSLVATAAVHTSSTSDERARSRVGLVAQAEEGRTDLARDRDRLLALQAETAQLRSRNLSLAARGGTETARVTRLGLLSGAEPASGPGVRVTADDAPGADRDAERVQAPDLQKLVNGLWLVGAEAVSVNGQRLTSLSAIRDAGEAITVNFVSLRAPYVVSAIGNPKTMGAALLDTAGGEAFVTLQSTFGLRFDVRTVADLDLPGKRVALRFASDAAPGTTRRAGESR